MECAECNDQIIVLRNRKRRDLADFALAALLLDFAAGRDRRITL
jgi:hypothetical protein